MVSHGGLFIPRELNEGLIPGHFLIAGTTNISESGSFYYGLDVIADAKKTLPEPYFYVPMMESLGSYRANLAELLISEYDQKLILDTNSDSGSNLMRNELFMVYDSATLTTGKSACFNLIPGSIFESWYFITKSNLRRLRD